MKDILENKTIVDYKYDKDYNLILFFMDGTKAHICYNCHGGVSVYAYNEEE